VDTASSSRSTNRAARPKPRRASTNPGGAIAQATADLTRYLTGGEFNPGDTVPSEAELRERFGLTEYAIRGALKELRETGVIITAQGKRGTLRQAKPRHTLTRDAGDPNRHLRPTGPPENQWRTADPVTAELFDLHDRAPLYISDLVCEHRTTGALVHTTRTVPADVIADTNPEPDPYGDRAALLKSFAEHYGPLTTTERCRIIPNPIDKIRTAIGVETAPVLEIRRLTRSATGQPLMIESEITDATAAEFEYPLHP
jgi:DNA-binding GntR family transcriptional regulator